MNNVIINNKPYPNIYIGFNVMCEWARNGIDFTKAEDAMAALPLIQAYAAKLMKTTLENAGDEIDKHMENGGSLEDIVNGMSEAFSQSGFFRNVNQTEEKASKKNTKA